MAEKFIQEAIERPGALTRKAKKAHMGVQEFAREHADSPGRTGKQARFALTLNKLRGGEENEAQKRALKRMK